MSLYLKQGINLFDTPLRKQKLHDLKKTKYPTKSLQNNFSVIFVVF